MLVVFNPTTLLFKSKELYNPKASTKLRSILLQLKIPYKYLLFQRGRKKEGRKQQQQQQTHTMVLWIKSVMEEVALFKELGQKE